MTWLKRRLAPFLPGSDSPEVTDGELALFIVCVLVTTIGLAGDIARHLQHPESLENDFISGWHLVLYGGVASVGAFIGLGAIRRGPGYVGAVATGSIGFALLSLGGALDAAWHEAFGTEAAVEALVSPPHLVVFAGLAFLLTAPVVVLWKREARRLGLIASVAAMVSVVSMVLVTSLFTGFLSPLSGGLSLQAGYVEPLVGESVQEYDTVRGLGIAVWTAAMLAAAMAVLLVRFRLVPGVLFLGFVLLGLPPLFVNGSTGVGGTTSVDIFNPLTVAFAVAGVTAEACIALMGRPTLGRIGASVTGAAVASSLWAATFAVLHSDGRLQWTEALWAGTVTLSALVGATVGALVALPVATGPSMSTGTVGPHPV
ncbi:MAG: hypothetical protein JWM47_625 [Acidimicrobiales bacterium]|nr:hypothetical protein [Acidimicrobiales bacterium]